MLEMENKKDFRWMQWRLRRLEVDPNAPEKATQLRESMLGF